MLSEKKVNLQRLRTSGYKSRYRFASERWHCMIVAGATTTYTLYTRQNSSTDKSKNRPDLSNVLKKVCTRPTFAGERSIYVRWATSRSLANVGFCAEKKYKTVSESRLTARSSARFTSIFYRKFSRRLSPSLR